MEDVFLEFLYVIYSIMEKHPKNWSHIQRFSTDKNAAEIGFLWRARNLAPCDKLHSFEISKALNFESFLIQAELYSYGSSATWLKFPTNSETA